MATNEDATWEVIDGLQRLTTLLYFTQPELVRAGGGHHSPLKLKGLEKVPSLNGATFDDLPSTIKLSFLTRPLRVTVLNDRSDYQVRFDLFERLNTGGITLHEQEIRNCVFQGAFNDLIRSCANDVRLDALVKRKDKAGRGNLEELALKFYAYLEWRENFSHSVKEFLNQYMAFKTDSFQNKTELSHIFDATMSVLSEALPGGIVRSNRPNSTPLVLFEAITVGVADVLASGGDVDFDKLREVLDDEGLKDLTTGATNSLPKLRARIDLVSKRVVA
jgi:hypothetical protein